MGELENKIALVTGSSRGIGSQVAVGLAQEGCNVIVHGRSHENNVNTLELVKKAGVEGYSLAGDLGSQDGVNRLIAEVKQKYGPLDILYNNAAIGSPSKTIWDFTQEDWTSLFQVNLYSMVALCSAFAPEMKERGYGRIINLSSGIKDQPQNAPYSVSKAAVDKYTKDLAYALRGTGVLVNYIDPGWIKTDLGGPNAHNELKDVLPGMLVPVLLDNDGPTGQGYRAMDYKGQ
jgi:3-oxoacyl-[acyl-carrier protein] reductase